MDGWSVTVPPPPTTVTQKMIVYRLRGILFKKTSNWTWKSKLILSRLVIILPSNITFHLQMIWLQNFGCYWFRIMPDIVSKLLLSAIWSCCAVQLVSVQTPFLRQVVNLDLMLCSVCTGFNSEHTVLFLCSIFTQRPMTDWNIEQSYGLCFGQQQLLANSFKNFISHKKNVA